MPTKALEAQRQLLAALFENPEVYPELERLEEFDFENDSRPYRAVWVALRQIISTGKRPTEADLASRTGLPLEQIGSIKRIEYDISQLEFYVETIIQASKQRALDNIKRASDLNEVKELVEVAEQHSQRLPSLDRAHVSHHIQKYIEQLNQEKDVPLEDRIIQTPFKDLNHLTTGMFNGDFICVAARPGLGKTAWLGCVIEHALSKDFGVASFILEMSPRRLFERFSARALGIPVADIITANLNENEWTKHFNHLNKLNKLPWYVYSVQDGISDFNRFRDVFLATYKEKKFRLATVDFLQLMYSGGFSNRNQEIGYIANGLAKLANEVNVPIIAASQLSRAVEARQDKRPILSDLRESGEIEQAAATVMFLYREGYYDPNTSRPNIAEVLVSKSRYGPTGVVELYWEGERMLFGDLNKDTVF